MTYRIVTADADDGEKLAYLHRVCFKTAIPPIDEAYWWLAVGDSGLVAAFAGLRTSPVEGAGYLWRSGVAPNHRGHGLQQRLIKVRERFARKLDLSVVTAETVSNTHSANNLIACGFRLYDPIMPWGTDDSLYWRKVL